MHKSSSREELLDCGLTVNEFELQSLSYIYSQNNTLGKGMSSHTHRPLIKWYHCSPSTRVALALDNPQRLIYHLTKQVKYYLPSRLGL